MGLFGGGKNSESDKKTAPNLSITSSPILPSKDMGEFVTENKQMPEDIKKRNWSRDINQVSLASLSVEEARRLKFESEFREDIKRINGQKVFIYIPGVDIKRQQEDIDYGLSYLTAMSKADNESGTPLADKLLSSSTLVETRQGDHRGEKEKKVGGIKGFLFGQ